ncbi:hypothetical protein GGI42DRAFT_245377 [Trichoderma sp. SZMC 28013]
MGAHEAMKLAKERIRGNPNIREVLLFLDNSAVVDDILGKTPDSSQKAYMGLRKIAKDLPPPPPPRVTTRVAWVPGHKDILGKEEADKLAKERGRLQKEYWDESQPSYYKTWRLFAPTMPPELHLPRAILGGDVANAGL